MVTLEELKMVEKNCHADFNPPLLKLYNQTDANVYVYY